MVAISLVLKLTSDDLLDRLRKKGTREPDYTRNLIIQKLNNDDDDVATTSLKVSVTCPLGKMRMKVSCDLLKLLRKIIFRLDKITDSVKPL